MKFGEQIAIDHYYFGLEVRREGIKNCGTGKDFPFLKDPMGFRTRSLKF